MSDITNRQREEVTLRAYNRCEYCRLSQLGQEATFHMDHVIPRAAGGPTTIDNLALACVSCSLRKWAHRTALDPDSGEEVPLLSRRHEPLDRETSPSRRRLRNRLAALLRMSGHAKAD